MTVPEMPKIENKPEQKPEQKPEVKLDQKKLDKKEKKKERKARRKKKTKVFSMSYGSLRILTGSDLSSRRLPLMEAKSVNPGPVVWITACAHGDEVGGMVIVQEVFKRLKKTPLSKGAIYAFPLMNPHGFETESREISLSTEDLNRSFPGNKNGTLAERIAEKIFTSIISKSPSVVIDLHNDWRKSVPYVLLDPDPGAELKETFEKAKQFAQKTGFVIVGEEKTEAISRSLSYTLIQHRIPALVFELGEAYVVNEHLVDDGVRGIWGILHDLGMVEPMPGEFHYKISPALDGKILRPSSRPFTTTTGIVRFYVEPGVFLKKGHIVARVFNVVGKTIETVTTLEDSFVIGHSDSSVAFPGVPIIFFGIDDNPVYLPATKESQLAPIK